MSKWSMNYQLKWFVGLIWLHNVAQVKLSSECLAFLTSICCDCKIGCFSVCLTTLYMSVECTVLFWNSVKFPMLELFNLFFVFIGSRSNEDTTKIITLFFNWLFKQFGYASTVLFFSLKKGMNFAVKFLFLNTIVKVQVTVSLNLKCIYFGIEIMN